MHCIVGESKWGLDSTTAFLLTRGDKAQFMFTSEMTNCRFSVLTSDMAKPMVAHVEGTGGFSKRDMFEVNAGFPARKEANARAVGFRHQESDP